MPIHKEVKSTLHIISHNLEMPSLIMTHTHDGSLKNNVKTVSVSKHEHKIIDLLDLFTDETDNNENSKIPNSIDIKIDKHFHTSKYVEHVFVLSKSLSIHTYYNEKIKDGFHTKIKIPPKSIKTQLS
jgi:hypothetical protein